MKITDSQIKEIAESIGLQYAHLKAFLMVESGNKGFDYSTGKIMIQFEPKWFSRKTGIEISHENSYKWDENQIEVQPKEWAAFNEAFAISKYAAMESTSIGLPQIMGFHWRLLGYHTVGAMWDDFKVSEYNQVKALSKFIVNNKMLHESLIVKDWDMVARMYNGAGYQQLAKRIGREPYNISLEKAYNKYSEVKNVA